MLQILKDLQEPGETFTHAAKRYHISPTSVSSIFDSVVSIPRAKLPEIMCTDENYAFHSKTQNSKYICLLIDQTNGQPIDILPSRRYEYLDKYFSNIPKYEIDQVHIMITDMYEPYRRIIKKHFKNAIHVVDHYHVFTGTAPQSGQGSLKDHKPPAMHQHIETHPGTRRKLLSVKTQERTPVQALYKI